MNEITARTVGGNSKNPSHDDAGNLTDDGENYIFTYDYRNRIVEVKRKSDTALKAKYEYDGFNRRVKKDLASGTDVLYLYDGWRCIEERELDGANWEARRQYVYGGQYIDEVLIFDKDTDADGVCDDARYLYCQNNNFNVMALTDGNGIVKERYKYDPYGAWDSGDTIFYS